MSAEPSAPGRRVAGKVALVTGAASGIGRATASLLAEHGATVTCADLNLTGVQETVAKIAAAGGAARPWQLDVSSEPAWREIYDEVLRVDRRLDIVVNCAGIACSSAIADTTLEEWRRLMAVNLDGVFLGTKHAIRSMRWITSGGSIVNVASAAGVRAQLDSSAYGASKAAVIFLSKVAARECKRSGYPIRVNSVSPGGVKTPIWKTLPFVQELIARTGSEEAALEAMSRELVDGRWATPEEIATGILYLASDEAAYVSGTDLIIDNGLTA